MTKFKRKLRSLTWFIVGIAPVLFLLALHFVDFASLPDLIADGSSFGFFGSLFADFASFFVSAPLSLYQLMLISILDWLLTLSLLRVVYDLLTIFTSWLYEVMDWRRKDD